MRTKALLILAILASLLGYMEWGQNNTAFVLEAEYQIIKGLFTDITSVIHPLTIIPLIGQLLLMFALFQKSPSKRLIYFGLIAIGILYIILLLVGLIAMRFTTILSTLPFFIILILLIRQLRQKH
ncbi:hypothetical protein AB9K26_02130 [Psychroserpens sp. XS_ASV72]|uniref:hypothetical protein n=1 Tax=Psychroserpens sp. XS_ASV72 TaxID=3241293 RepID=UPI003517B2B5